MIRAPVYDKSGKPARQRWTPPWDGASDRFDDPMEWVLLEVEHIAKLYRRNKLGLPFPGGGLAKVQAGLILLDQAINEAEGMAAACPDTGG